MLGEHRDDHSWVFRALAFMNGRRVRRHQHIEFSKCVSDRSAVEARNDLTRVGVNLVDGADIAVVDLLVVIVLNLHHLIAGSKGPAKPLDLPTTGGSACGLRLHGQSSRASTTTVHRTQHLDVAKWGEVQTAWGSVSSPTR